MNLPEDYAARLAALADDQLAAELRHVASGMAREAPRTAERRHWEERQRYVWIEWSRRKDAADMGGGWLWAFKEGWDYGRDRHELLPSPLDETHDTGRTL